MQEQDAGDQSAWAGAMPHSERLLLSFGPETYSVRLFESVVELQPALLSRI
jgi:phosphoribosylformylglycinamidine (FGAM) synthase-like amidotransferase family enzyme